MSPFRSRSERVRTVFLSAAAVATVIAASSSAAFAGSRPKPPPVTPPTTVVPVTTTSAPRDTVAPTVPTNFGPWPYSSPVPHQLDIQWNHSTDNVDYYTSLDYRVYLNGVSQGLVCAGAPYCFGESVTRVTNLVPGATYRLSVEAIDKAGNTSARSADYVFVGN
jgi:hypothetical protein